MSKEMSVITCVLVGCYLVSEFRGCQFYPDKVYGGIFADCSRRNLSSIPSDLPSDVTSLNLKGNNISELIVPRKPYFQSLKYLDVSHNVLSRLHSNTFKKLKNLHELFLNNNELMLNSTSYPEEVFQPLQNLIKLHLHNNDQRDEGKYPELAFAKLEKVQELKIDTFRETDFGFGFSKLFSLKRLILGFKGCNLARITNATFANFRSSPLVLLNLNDCPLVKLEIGSFIPMKSIKYLYMSNTKDLSPRSVLLAMYGFRGRELNSIEINRLFKVKDYRNEPISERILSNEYLSHIKDVCVEKMTMIENQLLWIGDALVEKTTFGKCIKYLDVSMNDFYGDIRYVFTVSELPNITYLNISKHGRIEQNSADSITHLRQSNIGLTFPSTLVSLNIAALAANSIEVTANLHIYNTTSLRHISVAYNKIRNISNSRITGLEDLASLDVSGNNCSVMNIHFYKDFPNLESLVMEDVKIGDRYILDYGKQLLSPLTKLRKISLGNNDIRILDTEIFSSNPLEEIILSNNRFESIPFNLGTTPTLLHLDISFNSLTILSKTEIDDLDALTLRNNLTLNLEGNLLSCGCQSLDFIMWLYSTDVHLIRGSTYMCQMSDGSLTSVSYVKDHYDEIWISCNGRMSLSITFILFAINLLVLFAIYITVKNKTLLVNIFLWMFGFGPLPPVLKRTDFPNDAYIGYSDADYHYICHTVRDHLENRHGLTLFIRDRDTLPGGQIADDIINGIDSSWMIVLYLTAAFLDDQWCRFTNNRVVYSSARMPSGNVILILSEDVRRGDIDPALLNIVEEKDIFYTERYKDNEEILWGDICKKINKIYS